MSKVRSKNRWPKPVVEFDIPIYGGRLYIFKTQEDFVNAESHLSGNPPKIVDCCFDGHATHFTHSTTGQSTYMIGWYSDKISTLIHELGHICVFVFKHSGMEIGDSDGEAFCYLQGWLFDQILSVANDTRGGK